MKTKTYSVHFFKGKGKTKGRKYFCDKEEAEIFFSKKILSCDNVYLYFHSNKVTSMVILLEYDKTELAKKVKNYLEKYHGIYSEPCDYFTEIKSWRGKISINFIFREENERKILRVKSDLFSSEENGVVRRLVSLDYKFFNI